MHQSDHIKKDEFSIMKEYRFHFHNNIFNYIDRCESEIFIKSIPLKKKSKSMFQNSTFVKEIIKYLGI